MPRRLILVLLMVITFAVLGRAVFGEFTLLDDNMTILRNPRLNPPTWETLAFYWDPRNPEFSLYMPVTYTVWAGIALIARVRGEIPGESILNPWMFHAGNIFIHTINVLLVFSILRRLIGRPTGKADSTAVRPVETTSTAKVTMMGAAIGALIFAIHPVQVESVAWASGMKDVLCAMFGLLALQCYLRFADPAPEVDEDGSPLEPLSRNARYGFYILGIILLSLGMLAKPSVMTVPLVAGIIARFILQRSWRDAIVSAGIWQLAILPLMWIAQIAQPATGVTPSPIWYRPLIVLDSIAFYVGKVIYPVDLSIDYGRTWFRVVTSGVMWWTMLVPLMLLVVACLARKDLRESLASLLIFVAFPFTTLGAATLVFSMYTTVSDHYLYLAMIGPALLTAALIRRFGKRAIVVAVLVLCMLGVLSFRQAGHWRNDFTLFAHALKVNPSSFLAASNLGSAYAAIGDDVQSERLFRQGLDANPEMFQVQLGYGLALIRLGRVDEGVEWCDAAMQTKAQLPPSIRGDLITPLYEVARTLMVKGHRDEAMRFIRIAAQTMPDSPQVRQLMDELSRSPATSQSEE